MTIVAIAEDLSPSSPSLKTRGTLGLINGSVGPARSFLSPSHSLSTFIAYTGYRGYRRGIGGIGDVLLANSIHELVQMLR